MNVQTRREIGDRGCGPDPKQQEVIKISTNIRPDTEDDHQHRTRGNHMHRERTMQRRHVDNAKKAPTTISEKHSKLLLTKNRPTEQTGTMTTPTTQTHQNDMMGHSLEKKRPHRQPRLPARDRNEIFTTELRPTK